ncbi:DUF222 domain-containing protein [Mycolicibacterium litorale]|uniref:DUF222 domain-containing protein n=1 Tax=Mycolicibacterium litorale TaxID=758802 RepID=UPI003CF8DFBD
MSSTREQIMDAMDAVETLSTRLAAMPVAGMSRAEAQAALIRLSGLREQLQEVERRMIGRLVASGTPAQFGARTWADVLARRLRISPGEAQRRIAEAISGDPSAA